MAAIVLDRIFYCLTSLLQRVDRGFPMAAIVATVVLHLNDIALKLLADAKQVWSAAAFSTEVIGNELARARRCAFKPSLIAV